MKKMRHDVFTMPRFLTELGEESKVWHLITSVIIVTVASCAFALLLGRSDCRFLGVVVPSAPGDSSMRYVPSTILALLALWLALTSRASIARSVTLDRPADIETEAYCLALPYGLLLASLAGLGLVLSVAAPDIGIYQPAEIYAVNKAAYLKLVVVGSNIAVVLFYASLGLAVGLLRTGFGTSAAPKDNSSHWVARWLTTRSVRSRTLGGKSLARALLILVASSAVVGYCGGLVFTSTLHPAIRAHLAAIALLLLWLSASWAIGLHRVKTLGDSRGLQLSALMTGWSLARYSLGMAILAVAGSMAREYVVGSNLDRILLIPTILVALAAFIDMLFVIANLILTAPTHKQPTDGAGADPYGRTHTAQASSSGDWLDATSLSVAQMETPTWRTVACTLYRFLILDVGGSWFVASHPNNYTLRTIMGVGFLALAICAHGLAVAALGAPALVSFISLNLFGIDYAVGAGSALLYVLAMASAIFIISRLPRAREAFIHTLALLGFALLPFTAAVLLLSLLSEHKWASNGLSLFPMLLVWALAYVAIHAYLNNRPPARSARALPLLLVAPLLTHFALGYLSQPAHLLFLRVTHMPLAQVRETIAQEVPMGIRSDITAAINGLANVDMVDVSVAELIDQVVLTKKAAKRFDQGDPIWTELSPIRIRCEVTSNGVWMRRLFPEMQQLTRSAKTPDEVVPIVHHWLAGKMHQVSPVTFPFGDKFDQDPITTLTCRRGDQLDAAILMVAALRAAGVPARIPTIHTDQFASGQFCLAEYYDGVDWKPCYPRIGPIRTISVVAEDQARLEKWVNSVLSRTPKLAFYVLVDGIWVPYCGGKRGEPAGYSLSLAPGTYLASYTVGDIVYMKRFVLRPVKAPTHSAEYRSSDHVLAQR